MRECVCVTVRPSLKGSIWLPAENGKNNVHSRRYWSGYWVAKQSNPSEHISLWRHWQYPQCIRLDYSRPLLPTDLGVREMLLTGGEGTRYILVGRRRESHWYCSYLYHSGVSLLRLRLTLWGVGLLFRGTLSLCRLAWRRLHLSVVMSLHHCSRLLPLRRTQNCFESLGEIAFSPCQTPHIIQRKWIGATNAVSAVIYWKFEPTNQLLCRMLHLKREGDQTELAADGEQTVQTSAGETCWGLVIYVPAQFEFPRLLRV